jgi:GTP-binding protein LepA
MIPPSHIRNFCIIAHIDHGKSTLADRLLQATHAISQREFREQVLDDMDLERERGITIKASSVRLRYEAADGQEYQLNLIDTPGHVDFAVEVSKSIAASEGALLVVDASQGVEAQTVANLYLAIEHHLTIIPVINKIDLSTADPKETRRQLREVLGPEADRAILASAKEGTGVGEILERIIRDVPAPQGDHQRPLQTLIFDSAFDTYKGVVIYVRVVNGMISPQMKIRFMGTGRTYTVQEVGICTPRLSLIDQLGSGEVGYITCHIRDPKEVLNGDTITDDAMPASQPLPSFRKLLPMVFSGIYPINAADFPALRDAVEKLALSDSAFHSETESSGAFGMGFRCGFLGLLHMEIVQERLEREYDLNLVVTTPSVVYRVTMTNGAVREVDNPMLMPPTGEIRQIEEPWVKAYIITPTENIGSILELVTQRSGIYHSTEYLTEERARLIFSLPLAEIIVDFYDRIKSMTRGYGSLDYAFEAYRVSKLAKLDILINGQICDALSSIVPREKAYPRGKQLVEKLQELIPRQLYEVIIQAAIGGQIIARTTVRPVGKNVTAKCYGGDITRKRKLWEKQRMGKRRMKQFGRVEIPQEAFLAVLKLS